MEYTVDLDLEDIETRLYSQIYHNNGDLEQTETSIIPNNTSVEENNKKKYRYFDNPMQNNSNILSEHNSFIPVVNSSEISETVVDTCLNITNISGETPNFAVHYSGQDKEIIKNHFPDNTKVIDTCLITAQTPITLPPNCSVGYSGQDREFFQNNITVNQYSFPFVINTDNILTSEPKAPTTKTPNESRRKKKIENKRKNRRKKRFQTLLQKQLKIYPRLDPIITICLSDSDQDDCNVVEEDMSDKNTKKVNTKFPKKYNEADGDKLPEIDDDVIFVPPPPVEVINVDSFEQSLDITDPVVENINEASTSELINPESNDFLETHIEPNNANFNFALHGSDFNTGPTEFREPLKPVEYCETESSCSTNEHHSRDFSNTVKTIVFDEVDFPREDIFSENNLESFSSFITPKRSLNKSKETVNISQIPKKLNENNISTDTSSSESDYETNSNKKTSNLPNLSPMVPYEPLNTRSTQGKNEPIKKPTDNSVKNKKDTNKSEKSSRRNNKRVAQDVVGNCSTPNTPKLKRKKKRFDNPAPLDKNTIVTSSSVHSVEIQDPVDIEPGNLPEAENSKKKKKKSDNPVPFDKNTVVTSLSVPSEDPVDVEQEDFLEAENSKRKKKKSNNPVQFDKKTAVTSSAVDSVEMEDPVEPENLPETENSKRKKKRSDNPVPFDKNTVVTSSSVHSEEIEDPVDVERENFLESDNSKRKKKKRSTSGQVKENEILNSSNGTELPKERVEVAENIFNEASTEIIKDNQDIKKKKRISISKNIDENSKEMEVSASTEEFEHLKAAASSLERLKKKKKNRESTSSENNPDEIVEQVVDKEPESVQSAVETFIKNIEITTELSQKLEKPKKKKKSENSFTETVTNFEIFDEINENSKLNVEESLDGSKKKKRKSGKEIDDVNTLPNQPEVQIDQTTPHCTSTLDPLNNSVTEIVDLDSCSIDTEIIVSSEDSDMDIEDLGDVGKDITLNCLIEKTNVNINDASILVQNDSQNDTDRIIATARMPLENFEKFNIYAIQRKQSNDPQKWLVSYKDKAAYLNSRGNRGPRCTRCKHFGHININCPDKPYPPPCILCGEPNHREPRCPFKMCTQCGQRGDYSTTYCYKCFKFRNSICRLCKMVGHIEISCPDLWRRYHQTTDQSSMVTLPLPAKPRPEQWCSGCAKQGHLEHECTYYNRYYPPTTPFVINYDDNLELDKYIKSQQQIVPTSLTNAPLVSDVKTPQPEVTLPATPVPSPHSQDVPSQMSNDVPGTSKKDKVISQMKRNFDNNENFQKNSPMSRYDNVDFEDESEIKKLIMTMPDRRVTGFIKDQLDTLNNAFSVDPRFLKRKIFRFDRLTDTKRDLPLRILREKNHWYRLLNKFIFGIHKHNLGHFHFNYLKRYLSQANDIRLDDNKRTALLNSYSYIFGCDKHVNIDYYKILRLLIRKYYSSSKNVP